MSIIRVDQEGSANKHLQTVHNRLLTILVVVTESADKWPSLIVVTEKRSMTYIVIVGEERHTS